MWTLKRNLMGHSEYYNPCDNSWNNTPIYFQTPIDCLFELRRLFYYTPILSFKDGHIEHQPHWNDDRHPSDISYEILRV